MNFVLAVRPWLKPMNKFKTYLKTFFFSWTWLLIPLLLLDQGTKMWAYNAKWQLTLIPNFLHLTYVRNTGAAWSLFSGNMPLLAVISAVVGSVVIGIRIYYRKQLSTLKKILLAVILAGAWGNFIDRAFYKVLLGTEGVVDFIHFQFGSYHFPIFNVADICVTLGILSLATIMILEDYKIIKPKAPKEGETHE